MSKHNTITLKHNTQIFLLQNVDKQIVTYSDFSSSII